MRMTLLIENSSSYREYDEYAGFFDNILKQTLTLLGLAVPVEVSLVLCDSEDIRALNREYRDKDQATDVLSFPMLDLFPLESESLNNDITDQAEPNTSETVLGDIVISVEKAAEQAEAYDHSLEREMGFLMVHGLLHLLGYDHEISDDVSSRMRQLEEEILAGLNLARR